MRNIKIALGAALFLIAAASASAQEKAAAAAPAPAKERKIVGSEACAMCHEDIPKAMLLKNPHRKLETDPRRKVQGHACEACHGGASAHTESLAKDDINNPKTMETGASRAICLTCHGDKKRHAGGQSACTTCHSMHRKPPTDDAAAAAAPAAAEPKAEAKAEVKTEAKVEAKAAPQAAAKATAAKKTKAGGAEPVNCLTAECHVHAGHTSHPPVAGGGDACVSCHTNVPAGHTANLVALDEGAAAKKAVGKVPADVCGTCHTNVVAQFQKPFHHKVPEGAMTCVDCHNPHTATKSPILRSMGANEPGCFKCHGDKRGPFTFDHAPVKFEGCGACHEAHGSANPRMLTRPTVNQVCLECHANLPAAPSSVAGVVPPAFHDLRSPRYQNCTVCHQKIHGSHVDRNLLK